MDDLKDDLLDGVPAIADFLGLSQRQVYYLAEQKKIPAFKFGDRKWSARKSSLRCHIAKLEARHAEAEAGHA